MNEENNRLRDRLKQIESQVRVSFIVQTSCLKLQTLQ